MSAATSGDGTNPERRCSTSLTQRKNMKPFSRTLFSLIGAVALTLVACATDLHAAWTPLFNGKDLTGWVKRGGNAPFIIENGEIIGTVQHGTANTFLCTEKNYANFILELEYNCHKDVNSGVQIRSEYNETDKSHTNLPPLPGKAKVRDKYKSRAKHVSGYQVEIEFAPGRTAGIYDEDRRNGWVYPAIGTDQDKEFCKQGIDPKIVKPGEWQKLRVEANGDSIKTYLDGVLRTDVKDSASDTGLIALQIHAASKKDDGKQVRFRNIRIQELPATAK